MFSFKKMILVILALVVAVCAFAQAKDKMDLQANPNPMKEYTEITFTLDSAQSVNLVITDSKGIVLRTIFNGELQKGKHGFGWDGSDYTNTRLPEGKYIIELNTESKFTSVKKIIILK
jgi:flagellar hook assembly protein FlgD